MRVFPLAPEFGHDHWQGRFRLAIEVRRLTQERARTASGWRVRNHTTHYYLSTAEFSAKDCARYVREHWHIENRLHYVLDQSLGEDAARIRRNPGVVAALRHFALNLMRFNGEQCIAAALYDNALCLDNALNYKGIRWRCTTLTSIPARHLLTSPAGSPAGPAGTGACHALGTQSIDP